MACSEESHTSGMYTTDASGSHAISPHLPSALLCLSTIITVCVCMCVMLQMDGSTLRTLCMQHGPLITFHLNLPHGNAVVCYSSKDEAAKAQKSLHM